MYLPFPRRRGVYIVCRYIGYRAAVRYNGIAVSEALAQGYVYLAYLQILPGIIILIVIKMLQVQYSRDSVVSCARVRAAGLLFLSETHQTST